MQQNKGKRCNNLLERKSWEICFVPIIKKCMEEPFLNPNFKLLVPIETDVAVVDKRGMRNDHGRTFEVVFSARGYLFV